MRHLWNHASVSLVFSYWLAVDSRMVRTGLKVWCCAGASAGQQEFRGRRSEFVHGLANCCSGTASVRPGKAVEADDG